MIQFSCPTCHSRYTVDDDRAGQRTTCPRCRNRLVVPAPERTRSGPPAKAVVKLVALFVGGLVVIGIGVGLVYLLRPKPTQSQVESRLRETLPPGFEDFKTVSYDRERGEYKFTVLFRDGFAPAGVRYEVVRYKAFEEMRGGGGWRVSVEGRKRLLERPFERWLVVEAVFDPSGKVVDKQGLTTAGPAEAAANEERAKLIALAVHGAF